VPNIYGIYIKLFQKNYQNINWSSGLHLLDSGFGARVRLPDMVYIEKLGDAMAPVVVIWLFMSLNKIFPSPNLKQK
jgi:hypothetical protein